MKLHLRADWGDAMATKRSWDSETHVTRMQKMAKCTKPMNLRQDSPKNSSNMYFGHFRPHFHRRRASGNISSVVADSVE